jgi:hypothetical protein
MRSHDFFLLTVSNILDVSDSVRGIEVADAEENDDDQKLDQDTKASTFNSLCSAKCPFILEYSSQPSSQPLNTQNHWKL